MSDNVEHEPAYSAIIGACAWSVGESLDDLDGYIIKSPNSSIESAKCGWRDIDRDYHWWCLIDQQRIKNESEHLKHWDQSGYDLASQ
ncbi:hypothetical protein CPT_Mendera_220 [Stenotrophomonas phage Mendera]|uniref:Uncharacterized protein n=1 Tax=Stenotrophomonas phage Mendera TaxID=2650877 RepID=A0A5P8PJ37_9CAUD|nr:hypothetical protein HWC60_gp195 [Stenotrophomonas phage Mendera]QFR56746.1 hypothetical protein CPT_Mendera_220 [Stenotrophomonas phage Mendera]